MKRQGGEREERRGERDGAPAAAATAAKPIDNRCESDAHVHVRGDEAEADTNARTATDGGGAGVINMDDIAEEEEEDQSEQASERAFLGLAGVLPCHGALNFIAFHSSRTMRGTGGEEGE